MMSSVTRLISLIYARFQSLLLVYLCLHQGPACGIELTGVAATEILLVVRTISSPLAVSTCLIASSTCLMRLSGRFGEYLISIYSKKLSTSEKWKDRIVIKVIETTGIGLTMPITILITEINPIVTEHYHSNAQWRKGLMSEVIV